MTTATWWPGQHGDVLNGVGRQRHGTSGGGAEEDRWLWEPLAAWLAGPMVEQVGGNNGGAHGDAGVGGGQIEILAEVEVAAEGVVPRRAGGLSLFFPVRMMRFLVADDGRERSRSGGRVVSFDRVRQSMEHLASGCHRWQVEHHMYSPIH